MLIILFHQLYTVYLSEVEIPLWMWQTVFGAILVAFFGYISTGILAPMTRDYLEKRKAKRLEEKEKLKEKIHFCDSCWTQFKFSIDHLQNYDLQSTCNIHAFTYLPTEVKKKVEEYIERYKLCQDLFMAVQCIIPQIIQKLIRSELPETAKTDYALESDLQGYDIPRRYMAGEKVNVTWLKENKPRLLGNIRKNLKDSESRLDRFFIELDRELKNDRVLSRFREERKALIEVGNQIINDLKRELESLQKELSRFQ